ncbi:hypothetical protein FZX09_01800 [Synechococcus sp. MU1643]|uniref:hypothetical protein n=1 Tax=Synechococcus sp. MU1643 TaxID=2508349 RepID=UPI001CF7FBF6|nr:hypothetical protein [Synechococcus sp. MU1643]MCB4427554.1 hypothetical protein [Synechococcus sp. MU1643]
MAGHRFLDFPECTEGNNEAPITFSTNDLNFEFLLIDQQQNFMFFLEKKDPRDLAREPGLTHLPVQRWFALVGLWSQAKVTRSFSQASF